MDVNTGEVLALVSLPDFDPNNPGTATPDRRLFNRVTLGTYEMGSTFKIFNTAMALDDASRDAGRQLRRDPSDPYRPLHHP